jgi:acylphosphatase
VAGRQVARRCIVSGRVQGVFFRASAARRARELGLVGHALNRDDGTVEVLAIGPQAEVDAMCAWLEVGPPAARVDRVAVVTEGLPVAVPPAFTTG